MSKSLKLKDNNYLDSTSIMHKRRVLSDFLEEQTITIETITTVNGKAIKFSDGTLIQMGHYSVGSIEIHTGAYMNVTLPIPFIDSDYVVSVNKSSGGTGGFANVADAFVKDENIIYFTHWNFGGLSEPITYCWSAIGRWK